MAKHLGLKMASKTVTAAGTPEALAASPILCTWLYILSKAGNTGSIHIGDSTVDNATNIGIELAAAGDAYVLTCQDQSVKIDLAQIYIDAAVNGEGVDLVYLA